MIEDENQNSNTPLRQHSETEPTPETNQPYQTPSNADPIAQTTTQPLASESATPQPPSEFPTPNSDPTPPPKKKTSLAWPAFKFLFLIVLLLVIYLIIVSWPLRMFYTQFSLLTNPNLVIFFNEAEARPCGGFVTAFGKFKALPPKYELQNAYQFQGIDFGDAPDPLTRVSKKLNFWDLGTHHDPKACIEVFSQAYEASSGEKVGATWLVNFSTVEAVFGLVAPMEIDGVTYTADNFFATLSRSVADVDRHNEKALETRKQPLSTIGKSIIRRVITNPIKSFKVSGIVRDAIRSGDIYLTGFSPVPDLNEDQFKVIEWNLGGGKTSRFLKKRLKIRLKQNPNTTWNGTVVFEVEHLGGFDRPISQNYQGVIEIHLPQSLGNTQDRLDIDLKPGESFEKEYNIGDKILDQKLSFFVPRGQYLDVDMAMTAFPQQTLHSQDADLLTHEYIATFQKTLKYPGKTLLWTYGEDTLAPFPTLHEVIKAQNLSRDIRNRMAGANFFVEVHFNERVRIDGEFKAELLDTNYENTETDHPTLRSHQLLDDQKTLILGFRQSKQQINERFLLSLYGARDLWNNRLEGKDRWTVIPR